MESKSKMHMLIKEWIQVYTKALANVLETYQFIRI